VPEEARLNFLASISRVSVRSKSHIYGGRGSVRPLIKRAGEIVGINTALIGPTGSNVGIGFTVPRNPTRAALARILARWAGG
jgi:hypothetical protein